MKLTSLNVGSDGGADGATQGLCHEHSKAASIGEGGREMSGTAGQRAQVEQALDDLRFHWDEAYKITYHPGDAEPCHAERLDDGTLLTADLPWALYDKITDDYRIRPVPRLNPASEPGVRTRATSLTCTADGRLDAC